MKTSKAILRIKGKEVAVMPIKEERARAHITRHKERDERLGIKRKIITILDEYLPREESLKLLKQGKIRKIEAQALTRAFWEVIEDA